ncbi:hypothetical protein [Aestuariivita sp.]|uniref:hypothetical protein n=1 Tax=Aestuariivita sp. TaxID=1872407 RepID=UPI0021730A32|nr:hypothetical protein [Aestuariivita sp.]MCE8005979.1 hypothetical protein [Aestuariivita sp.]
MNTFAVGKGSRFQRASRSHVDARNCTVDRMSQDSSGKFLRYLVQVRGWSVKEFIGKLEQAAVDADEVFDNLAPGRVADWFVNGPPSNGTRHRALLACFNIVPGSTEHEILLGLRPWHGVGHTLANWLHALPARVDNTILRPKNWRGLQPPAEGSVDERKIVPLGGMLDLLIPCSTDCLLFVFNHSYPDNQTVMLHPGHSWGECRHEKIGAQIVIPSSLLDEREKGFAIGPPVGPNDLFVVSFSDESQVLDLYEQNFPVRDIRGDSLAKELSQFSKEVEAVFVSRYRIESV